MSTRFLRDNIRTAASALWARKTRSALSILGIIVGILTVASLLSVALGVKKEVSRSIEGLGSNTILVLPGKVTEGGTPNFAAQLGASTLTEEDFYAIRETAPEAQHVAMAMLLAGTIKTEEKDVPSTFLFAGSPGIEHVFDYHIQQGRLLTDGDERDRTRVVVLGSSVVPALFGDKTPVGQVVHIRGEAFTVVGVFAELPSGISFGGPDFNSIVMMPLATGWEISGTKQVFRIGMQAPDADSTMALREKVKATLLSRHGGEEDFTVFTQDDLLDMIGGIFDILTAMLSAISAISLLVGGIGIMNIMLVSVSERTREIGIRKAVGATRGAILLQFLIESMMLTFVGGLVAVALFSLGVLLVQDRAPIPIALDPFVLGLALGFSALVGIVFGIVPAIRASRMHPIEALRHE